MHDAFYLAGTIAISLVVGILINTLLKGKFKKLTREETEQKSFHQK